MALSEDEILILTRLLGVREFVAGAEAESAAVGELGLASETTGRKMEIAGRRGFFLNQTLFTMRRLVYGASLALIGMGIASVKWGFDFNSAMQQARVALGPVFRDTGALNRQLNYLFNFTKYTPFQFKDITIAFRQMYAAFHPLGIDVDTTNQTIKAIVDALAYAGRTSPGALNRVAVALQHMAYQGHLTGQTVLQLARDGLPIFPVLQKELGLTADQMHQVGKLGIPTLTVLQALIKYIETTPGYENAAYRQATRSWHGLFTTFKDNLSQLMGAVEKGFFQRTQHGLVRLNEWFNRFSNTVRTGNTDAIMRAIGGRGAVLIWNQLAGAFRNAWSAFKILTATLTQSQLIWGTILLTLGLIRGVLWFVAQNAHLIGAMLKILLPIWLVWITYMKLSAIWLGVNKALEISTTKAIKEMTFAQFLLSVAMGRYQLLLKLQTAFLFLWVTASTAAAAAAEYLYVSILALGVLLETTPVGWILTILAIIPLLVVLYLKWKAFHDIVNQTIGWLWQHPLATVIMPIIGPLLTVAHLFQLIYENAARLYNLLRHPIRSAEHVAHGFSFTGAAKTALNLINPFHFATGGTMGQGWNLIGERGPELLNFSTGQVIPAPQAAAVGAAATRQSGLRPLVVQVAIEKRVIAEAVTDVLATDGARA